jgi:hypothetical protein
MSDGPIRDPDIDEYFDRIRAGVDEHGWMVQGVGPSPGADKYPLCYTVGLWPRIGLEYAIIGPPPEHAATILNDVATAATEGGRRWVHGETSDDFLPGLPLMFLDVTRRDAPYVLAVADALYGLEGPVPAQQLVGPDQIGRWPWEPGSTIADLPLLGEPPS